jgi:F0F1-type ATP synthase assembly protein I
MSLESSFFYKNLEALTPYKFHRKIQVFLRAGAKRLRLKIAIALVISLKILTGLTFFQNQEKIYNVVFEPFFTMENKNNKQESPWWQPAIAIFARLSGWIAVPVIAAIFVGKSLDKKYDTQPWLFLLSVGIAFIFSMVGIVKDTMREIKKIEKEEKDKKSKV